MKNKSKKIILLIITGIFIIASSVLTLLYGGLMGIFHLKTERNENIIEQPTVNEVSIREKDGSNIFVYLNETKQLTLEDNLGTSKINAWNFTWISSDVSVAVISNTGLLIPKSVGTTVVRVTNKNDVNLFDVVKVEVLDKTNNLKIKKDSDTTKPLILDEIKKVELITGGKVSQNDIIWISSDKNILSVIDGYVYAHNIGRATITATSSYDSMYSDSIEFEVKDNSIQITPISKININHLYVNRKEVCLDDMSKMVFRSDDEIVINASSDCSQYSPVVFSSVNGLCECISQDNHTGTFKVKKIGRDFIKIASKYNSDVYQLIEIRICNQLKEITYFNISNSFKVEDDTYFMQVNSIQSFEIISEKGSIAYNDLVVEIENSEVLAYSNGYLIANNTGKTKVSISYLYDINRKIEMDVEVIEENQTIIPLKHLSIDYLSINGLQYLPSYLDENIVSVGDSATFEINISPFDASYLNEVKVISENPEIATVKVAKENRNYKVTIDFIKEGKTRIIIRPLGNLKEEKVIYFTVGSNYEIPDFSISIPKELFAGKEYNIKIKLQNGNIDENQVKYQFSSSNEDIASVGPNGNLLAYDKGKVTITVTGSIGDIIVTQTKEIEINKEYKRYERVKEMICKTYIRENDKYVPIDFTTQFLNVYQNAYFEVKVFPNYNNANNYVVYSDNERVVSIVYQDNMYQIQPLLPGVATIKIKNYEDVSLSQEIKIVVCDILPKYFIPKLEKTNLTIGENELIEFIVDNRATYTFPNISFSTEGIVEIKNNYLIPKHVGKTTLIVEVSNDLNKYRMTLPIQVISKEKKSFSSFSMEEIISFFVFFSITTLIFSFNLFTLVVESKLQNKNRLIILFITSLAIITIPQVLSMSIWNIKVKIINLLIECVGITLGIVLAYIINKRGKKNE